MKSKFIGIATLLFLLPVLLMGQQVTFTAYADAKQVLKDAYFEVSFTLKNGDGDGFRPPAFKGFKVVAGPSRSVSTSIINGSVSREMSYGYGLVAKKKGRFRIKGATVKVQGKTYRTKPISIEVLARKKGGEAPKENVFVKGVFQKTEIWEGQQLPFLYKLYFSNVRIANISIIDEPEYDGFFAQVVRNTDLRNVREVIDGVQYEGRIVKKMVLFPQRTGTFRLNPLTLQISIVKGQSGFFRRNLVYETIRTEPIDIIVKPLPADAPPTFNGSIGQFSIFAEVNKRNLSTDDALTLRLKISGNGDIKRIHSPDIALPDGFELYDPSTIGETTYSGGNGMLISEKIFEYIIVPTKVGSFKIKPAFTYFDTDSSKYVTLSNQVFDLSIRQGNNKASDISIPEVKEEIKDILPIQTSTNLKKGGAQFFKSTLFWVLCIVPILALIGGFFVKQLQQKQANLDPAAVKHKRARKLALKKLETAELLKTENKSSEFYTEISSAMFGYVCDKLHIPLSTLNKENVAQKLASLGIKDGIIQDFMQVIKNCEIALYAGMDNSAAMQETFDTSARLLTEIEEGLG